MTCLLAGRTGFYAFGWGNGSDAVRHEKPGHERAANLLMLASPVPEMYLVCTGLGRGWTGGLSPMGTSPFSPDEIRAAAAAHKELGPEYSDAVIESFLERVDREIDARVDARIGPVSRTPPVQPAQSNGRRTLLTGVAIGIFITGVPSAMVAASAGGVIAKDEAQVLFIVGILWAIAVAIAAFAYPVSYYRRKEHGIRQTGRQAP
jgi:hypothetical protein